MAANPGTKISRCSLISSETNENLYATAPRTDVWILIEWQDAMGANAVIDSNLPDPVKSYLGQCQKSIPHSRLLLIRKEHHTSTKEKSVFVCISGGNTPRLYRTQLAEYNEILAIDIPGLIKGSSLGNFAIVQEQLFLICTNGKRDPCCAQWGIPVFKSASLHAGESVWQSSHVGGHRFAANLICLPHGIYYGRVRPENVSALIDDYQDNLISLEHYRGRSCYPPEAQAAEFFLYHETIYRDIDAYRLESVCTVSDTLREIVLSSNLDGTHYSVHVSVEHSQTEIFESCSTPDKLIRPPRYILEGWSKL